MNAPQKRKHKLLFGDALLVGCILLVCIALAIVPHLSKKATSAFVKVTVDGKSYPAVTNVGTRPTVNGHSITVEPWILDYQGDLYGKEIRLEFYRFLRPEKKFPDLQALKAEILRNADETREYFKNQDVQTMFIG